ncbi:MAG: GNAT family N-acetyltransferase [Solobacterium sp.]|nr:GNAT family N-acetyltransferase [Solobacterium sp.]
MEKVKIKEIVDAMDMNDQDTQAFYNSEAGSVVFLTRGRYYDRMMNQANVISEDSLTPLPDRFEINDYHNMELFIEACDDETAAEWMRNAIHGRGAFRMFRAACERFHLLSDWYEFRERRHAETAVSWCLENGFEYDLSEEYADLEDDLYFDPYEEDEIQEEEKEPAPVLHNEPQWRIAKISRSNVSGVVYLYADALDAAGARRGRKPQKDIEKAGQLLDEYLDKGYGVFACAKAGRFSGICIVRPEENAAVLECLYVRKENRRSGAGRTLLEYADEYCRDEYGKSTVIEYYPDHTGYLFLKRCGFHTIASVRLCRDDADTKESVSFGEENFLLKA